MTTNAEGREILEMTCESTEKHEFNEYSQRTGGSMVNKKSVKIDRPHCCTVPVSDIS